jgi:predicted SAM-dependent methyltransferase
MWHQLDEVSNMNPNRVLELGPGPGLFKAIACQLGLKVETLDLDPELQPDHVASALEMPFRNEEFDVVCAFQMLEHLPFEQSLRAFREMTRVAKYGVVVSLPDAKECWRYSIDVPKIGTLKFFVPKPRLRKRLHEFDGEHYWEINKAGYSLERIERAFAAQGRVALERSFRVQENPYHRFFVFKKI